MRQIVLDTETTGLSANNGDRIIEIGCVELLNRKLTGNNLHFYVNPERDSHEEALKVHGHAYAKLLPETAYWIRVARAGAEPMMSLEADLF